MRVQFIPDNPVDSTLGDTLGFGRFLDLLEDALYYTEPPFTYGVLGDWGVGKTSILHLLQNRLDKKFTTNEQPYVPIWFNAWKYENETNIIYPLLYAIKRDYERRLTSKEFANDFFNQLKKVAASSALALTDLGLRAATKKLTGEAIKLEDAADYIQQVNEHDESLSKLLGDWADEVTHLEEKFDKLLDIYARDIAKGTEFNAKDVRFVILVDDLDRCLPETTIRILEGIKNFLTTKRTIFVLALNPTIVYKGIAIKYRGLEVNGREYLEKILNYSFNVPEPTTDNVRQFVERQFEKLVPDEEDRRPHQERFTEFGKVLDQCNFNNPRKIKRILNRYLFFLQLYEPHLDYYINDQIIRLIIMAEYYPEIFQLYLEQQVAEETKGLLKHIGEQQFDLQKFEERSGLSIRSRYSDLVSKHELFNVILGSKPNKALLQEHARIVGQLSQGVS